MSLEQMLKEREKSKQHLSDYIDLLRILTEEPGAEVSIHIRAEYPTHRDEDGEVLNTATRSCHIETINHRNDEDIEALKQILCKHTEIMKEKNAGITTEMISMLQEDTDQ